MKEEEVEVTGGLHYQRESLVSVVQSDKIREELKQFMMNNGLVKIDVALVPKGVE